MKTEIRIINELIEYCIRHKLEFKIYYDKESFGGGCFMQAGEHKWFANGPLLSEGFLIQAATQLYARNYCSYDDK